MQLDRLNIPKIILWYIYMQLILGNLQGKLFFNLLGDAASVVLSTWSLLCGGQHSVDAVVPFLTQ